MLQKRSILFIGLMVLLVLNGLGEATELSLPGAPTCATIADFNRDLKSDLAIGTDGTILIYSGNGGGSFSAPAIVPFSGLPNVIKAADVNGDGGVDLIVSDRKMGRIKILLNKYGEFSSEIHTENGSRAANDIVLYDFNADGYLDMALAENNSVSIWYGLGDYNSKGKAWFFSWENYPIPRGPLSAIGKADFNQDGLADLVVVGGNMLYVLTQETKGFTITARAQTGYNPVALAIADFNHDAVLDIVVANKGSNSVGLFYGKLEGGLYSLEHPVYYSVGYSPSSLAIADFNSDNYLDIAVGCEGSNAVYFLLSTGLGNFTPSDKTISTESSPIKVLATDFDNNGKMDLLTINQNTVKIFKDQEISAQLDFKLCEVDIKIRKNGEGDPIDGPLMVTTNVNDKIEVFGSLNSNDCHGYRADFYLLLNAVTPDLSGEEAKAETNTYSITANGITEGEAPFARDLNITNIPEVPLWSFSTQDLAREIGCGYYSIVGKLVIKGASGLTYYVSDAAEFGITGRIISDPPIVNVNLNTDAGRVKAYATVEANNAAALPAFAYLWIDCSRTDVFILEVDNETQIVIKTSIFKEWYTPTGWHTYEKYYWVESGELQEAEEGTKPDYIPPFTVWSVTDLTDYPLFDFPRSYFPSGYVCEVHAGFIIENWDGMNYSVFDYDSFYNY